jgi:hypothetical protein
MGKGDKVTDKVNKGIPRDELEWAEFILGGGEGELEYDDPYLDVDEEEWEDLYNARLGVLRSIIPTDATPASLCPDAPRERVEPLIRRADEIANDMEEMSTVQLRAVTTRTGQLALELEQLQSEINKLALRMSAANAQYLKLAGREGDLKKAATQDEANDLGLALLAAKNAIDERPLTEMAVSEAETAVGKSGNLARAIIASAKTRQELLTTLRKLVPEGADETTLVPDAPDHEVDPILRKARDLADDISKAGDGDFDDIRNEIERLSTDLDKVKDDIGKLRERVNTQAEVLARIGVPEDALKAERAALEPLIETAKQKIALRPFTPDGADEAEEAVKAASDELQKIQAAAVERLKSNKALCTKLGIPEDEINAYAATLGGHDALADVIKVFSVDEFDAISTAFGGKSAGAGKIKGFLDAYGGAAALKKAMDDLGGAARMAAFADAGHKTAAETKAILNGLGPGFVGELMGSGNDPQKAIDLHAAFGTDVDKFTKLAADTGLDAQPKAMLELLNGPCKGDIAAFKTFCGKFDDDDDRKNLKGLLTDAGVGASPKAMSALFVDGCGGDAEQIKAMAAAMKDDDARKGLAEMLTNGGLDGSDPDIGADVLGQLAKHVSGDQPTGVSDTDFATTRGTALAELAKAFKGSGATGPAADLKASLKEGGLGKDPEVFAHLIGAGCEKGDPTKTKALLSAIKGDAAAFKNMLQKGGLGTKDDSNTATGVDARCLGALLEPGCNGKPDEMIKLAKALGDTTANPGALASLKTVMKDGELGKHPKVFGKMYEHGCLDEPDKGHDGKKSPKVLIDMVGEFNGQGPLFKSMLDDGGFTEGGKEERLASVMRHAFTPKPPAAQKQDAKSLRKLANSFNGNFADLKTTMAALEGADDWVLENSQANKPNQPGKGLGNVIHAPKFSGNPERLRADFFVPISNRAAAVAVPPETTWVTPKMDQTTLLQTAASFEHVPVSSAVVAVAPHYNINNDHICERHTRKHSTQSHNPAFAHLPTTLYPRTITETEIRTLVLESIDPTRCNRAPTPPHLPAPAPNRADGTPKNNPPVDAQDMDGAFTRCDGTDTSGNSCRLGFAADGPATDFRIRQFYPTGGPNLVQVNNNDLAAMRAALH